MLNAESNRQKRVAIVVPLSLRAELTSDEQISVRQLRTHLDAYDKYLIAPKSNPAEWSGFETIPTSDRFFGSGIAHAELVLSDEFYAQFSGYDYILLYHLDALVFSNQLLDWCDAGFDYIGAPLRDDNGELTLVGNGGFALRRVAAFRRLLASRRRSVEKPIEKWRQRYGSSSLMSRATSLPIWLAKSLGIRNSLTSEIRSGLRTKFFYEDLFMATRARYFDPDFNIAPVEQALKFAFDEFPRRCYERNGRQLPFGCHAWGKYDRAFWLEQLQTQHSPLEGSHAR